MPTEGKEEIKCINPVYIDESDDIKNLNDLISGLEKKFQVEPEVSIATINSNKEAISCYIENPDSCESCSG
jgi:hypothetical protein